jgi:hypothetical protein
MQWPDSGWSGRTTFIVHEWDTPGDGQYRHFISESGSFHGDNGTKVFSGSYGGKMAYNGTGRVNGTAVTMSTLNKDIVPNMLQMTFTAQAPYDGLASNDAGNLSRTFWGHFAEVLVYEEVLTTTQIEDIEGYLAWKWDFVSELPPTHPYKSSPP